MDEVEIQQGMVDAAVSAVFGVWRSQLRVQLEESSVRTGELEKKSEELRQLQQSLSNFHAVRQENEQLREELRALRSQYGSATSPRQYQKLEHEHDALLKDNQLKQKTINILQGMVNYEKSKSKDWSRHSNTSPSPAVSGRSSSPRQPVKSGWKTDTATLADGVSVLSDQALLQNLVLPLKNLEAPVESPTSLGHKHSEQHTRTMSVEDSANEDALLPPPAIQGSNHQNGPKSFPDFDATYSHGDSSSECPPTTSPHARSIPVMRRSGNSPLLHECFGQSVTEHFPSDSTAPLSQSCRKHEYKEDKLPYDSSPDPLEVVSALPVGRRAQKINILAGDAKLAGRQVGNTEELIRVKTEPSESFRTTANKASGLMLTTDESLGGESFNSPKEGRDPQLSAALSKRTILHIAEDRTLGPDNKYLDVKHLEFDSDRKDDKPRSSADDTQPRPLQEIKNDKRTLPRTSNTSGPPGKKRRSNDGRGAVAIPVVAEDGEDHNRSHQAAAAKLPRSASPARSNTSAYRRLGGLLEGPSPAKPVLTKPSSRTSNLMDGYLLNAAASAKSAKKDQLDTMRFSEDKSWEWYESAENLLDSVGSQRPPEPEKRPTQTLAESDAVTWKAQNEPQRQSLAPKRRLLDGPEDEESFRSRSLHRLNLDHFKINPQANAGVDYAYTDVIRNRDQRKCLPGCTHLECCGTKFRSLAGTLPNLTSDGKSVHRSDPSSNARLQQSENDLLKNFLGPRSEEKIRTLTPLARENLLLEAKTKIAADKYGKMHRRAHERPKSPPGFWRTEMPGTQEEVVDRLDAKKREREEVERRYREACKKGGMWVFADE